MTPDISVVIPCFNLGSTVEEAIDSVLAQTRVVAEIIVIDDGSTDEETRRILESLVRPRTCVIRTRNQGLSRARNTGIDRTTSAYVTTLDADDCFDPDYVAVLAGHLDAHTRVDFVGCALRAFGGANYTWAPEADLIGGLVKGGYHASTMFRRIVYDAVGGFDPSMPAFETTDFYATALELGFQGTVLPDPLLRYRVRRQSRYHLALDSGRFQEARSAMFTKHARALHAQMDSALATSDVFRTELLQHRRHLIATTTPTRIDAPRPGTSGVSQPVSSAATPCGGLVLLYHRIGEVPSDARNLCLDKVAFEQQMRWLRQTCEVLPLREFAASIRDNRLPRRAVSVTLDDGYFDALQNVAPILQDCGASATFFVNSFEWSAGTEFWGDTVERLFLEGYPLPARLDISVNGLELADALDSHENRRRVWRIVNDAFYPLSAVQRAELLQALVDWSRLSVEPRPTHRRMTCDEVRILSRFPGCTIGAHTVNHLRLTSHSGDVQRWEMAENRRQLEETTGHIVDAIAYPYGIYDDTTVDIATTIPFSIGLTVDAGLVTARTNPLRWPRLEPPKAIDDFRSCLATAFG